MGLQVFVTVSHSRPYDVSDADLLMKNIIADPNVDYLSPELYTSGTEANNDYTNVGTFWYQYQAASARIVPSIVSASHHPDAVRYFAAQRITLTGYAQWKQ